MTEVVFFQIRVTVVASSNEEQFSSSFLTFLLVRKVGGQRPEPLHSHQEKAFLSNSGYPEDILVV